MAEITWRIRYDDGTTFDNTMGVPEDAPPWGVQAITLNDNGKTVASNTHYYVWDGGRFYGMNQAGLVDWLARTGLVKFGRFIPNERYEEILYAATHDPDFPSVSPTPEMKEAYRQIEPPRGE